jgi:hypothetical protein
MRTVGQKGRTDRTDGIIYECASQNRNSSQEYDTLYAYTHHNIALKDLTKAQNAFRYISIILAIYELENKTRNVACSLTQGDPNRAKLPNW